MRTHVHSSRPPVQGERDGQTNITLDKCGLVKYNATGSLLAIAGGPGCKDVHVFSTLYRKQVALLQGHYHAVQVRMGGRVWVGVGVRGGEGTTLLCRCVWVGVCVWGGGGVVGGAQPCC